MATVKESLISAIQNLSEDEAREVLEFIEVIRRKETKSEIWSRLSGDPAFKLPPEGLGGFDEVQPVQGTGMPASRLLIRDRR